MSNSANIRDFSKRKWKTRNKFTGKRRSGAKKQKIDAFTTISDQNVDTNQNKSSVITAIQDIEFEGQLPSTSKVIPNNFNAGPSISNQDHFESSHLEPNSDINDFISASKFKLQGFKNAHENISTNNNCVIVNMGALNELICKGTVCMHCKQHSLFVREDPKKHKGLATILEIVCSNDNCEHHNQAPMSVYSSAKTTSGTALQTTFQVATRKSGSSKSPFIINLQAVLAARSIGIGYEQLARFCAIMGLSKPLHKLHSAATSAMKENLGEVKEKIHTLYDDMFGSQVESDTHYEPGEMGVMYDGTWQKRGHKSHNGVGVAIDLHSGYVVDVEVLSNFCVGCQKGPKEEDAQYGEWILSHKLKCQKNIDTSSHAMEVEAALKIWERSKNSGLKYTIFLSDGDSKAYKAVVDMKPYGDAVSIIKEDCVNHVSKRFGTALRKLNPELPRGNKLSDALIRTLSFYYQLALVNNKGDASKMYNAVLATLLHCSSNNESSNHRLCPEGDQSWCPWQKSISLGKEPPVHEPRLNEIQAKALVPIYKRMADPELLKRCVKGKTQNAAESFNSRIWNLCPKTRFASLMAVETAVAISVLQFNKGMSGLTDILKFLKIGMTAPLQMYSIKEDDKRIQQMQRKMTASVRQTRKAKKLEEAKQSDRLRQREGFTYYSGEFDTEMLDH